MRLPPAINWLRSYNAPGDLLVTFKDPHSKTELFPPIRTGLRSWTQEQQYSQILSQNLMRDFLYDLIDTWLDSLELQTVKIPVRDEDGDFVYVDIVESGDKVYEEQERLVGTRLNNTAIYIKGLDFSSTEDDIGIHFNLLKPDTDIEGLRENFQSIIESHISLPLQISKIDIYISEALPQEDIRYTKQSTHIEARPLNSVDLTEFFKLTK